MSPRSLTNRTGSTWLESLDPGDYALNATVLDPTMVGTASASVRRGQTTTVTITLRPGTTVAQAFVVSFRYNSAFVEPCARPVLRAIQARAAANPAEKMLVVGHTDKAGRLAYNQSLGERRARAVFAYLTFGRAAQASVDEWTALRRRRAPGEVTTLADSWDVREYQHMLQDLGFYPGLIDGRDGPMTQEAVDEFRCSVGLPPGTMDDPAWDKLIRRYMGQDDIGIPEAKLFANCDGEFLKWVACGEEAPLPTPQPTKGTAHRPYRRVEVLFVTASTLPCTVPQPDTFNLPGKGSVGSGWCVGPGAANAHCCFGTRSCAKAASGQWCIQSAETQTMQVTGTLRREVRAPNGTITLSPVAGARFVMITPDGEFKGGEQTSGEPIPARTAANGSFRFPNVRVGTFHFEVVDGGLARLATGTVLDAKGPSVCARLAAPADVLDVVLVAAPVLRQIRLPVVVHLMTALHPTTREIRTCPDPRTPGTTVQQRTVRTAADVTTIFAGANRIWEQARIAFDVVEVTQEVFATAGRTECAVDFTEFDDIFFEAGYPGVVNLYLFGTLRSIGGAGVYRAVSRTDAAGNVDLAHAVAAGDSVLQERIVGLPPVPVQVSASGPDAVQVVAHELGHYLTLTHVETDPAPNRLMLSQGNPANQHLIRAEVDQARSSPDARSVCAPLSLSVTGADSVGGPRSGLFVAPVVDGTNVTVDAQISPELLAAGTVEWSGGAPGANPLQRIVDASFDRNEKVRATYRPNAGGHEATTFVRILVTGFALNVTGATRAGAAPGVFIARPDPLQPVIVDVVLDRAPRTLTRDLVTWSGGVENVDPLRRTVPRTISRTVVSATVAGVTQSVTIIGFDISIAPARPPHAPRLDTVMIEGIANPDRRRVSQANLAAGQAASLFCGRADIPGIALNAVTATLTSAAPGGATIEAVPVVLRRQAGTDTFVSLPLLAIPQIAGRAGLGFAAPKDMEVVLARAGGTLTLQIPGTFGRETAQARVRGRVVQLFIQVFTGSRGSLADVATHVGEVVAIWAQAGIEVRERTPAVEVAPPTNDLLEFEYDDGTGPATTQDERRIWGVEAPSPARSAVGTDINVYYVEELKGSKGFVAVAYDTRGVIVVEARGVSDLALAHEVGHHILSAWPGGNDHKDAAGADWPVSNVMFRADLGIGRDVDRSQVANIVANTAAIRCVVIEP